MTDVVCVPHLIECAVGKSACLAGSGVAPFQLGCRVNATSMYRACVTARAYSGRQKGAARCARDARDTSALPLRRPSDVQLPRKRTSYERAATFLYFNLYTQCKITT